jgi:DNA-binding transcriptional ArsR family regulator
LNEGLQQEEQMSEMSPEDWLATHKAEGAPTRVQTLENAVQSAYDDIADAIKLLAAGSYTPAQEPLREALSWLKIADEADAWIKMTEAELERRRPGSPEDRSP